MANIGRYYYWDPYNFYNIYLCSLVKWVTQKAIARDIRNLQGRYLWSTDTKTEIGSGFFFFLQYCIKWKLEYFLFSHYIAWYFTKPCLFEVECQIVFLEYDKFSLDLEKGFGESDWWKVEKRTKEERRHMEVEARGGRWNIPQNEMRKNSHEISLTNEIILNHLISSPTEWQVLWWKKLKGSCSQHDP